MLAITASGLKVLAGSITWLLLFLKLSPSDRMLQASSGPGHVLYLHSQVGQE